MSGRRRARWIGAALLAAAVGAVAYWWPEPERGARGAADEAANTQESGRAEAEGAAPEPVQWPSEGPCGHPYVPSEAGQWRRYELRTGDGEPESLTLRVESAEQTGGEWEVAWQLELGEQRYRLTRRCNSRAGAEDPWYGYMPAGRELAQAPSTWRFPSSVEQGAQFSGSSTLRMPRTALAPDAGSIEVDVSREYRVTGTEVLETEAGAFDARRIAFDERRRVDGEASETDGTLWLAEGVGLVRAVTNENAFRKEWRLVALGDGEKTG